jgi:hypothetical protein
MRERDGPQAEPGMWHGAGTAHRILPRAFFLALGCFSAATMVAFLEMALDARVGKVAS